MLFCFWPIVYWQHNEECWLDCINLHDDKSTNLTVIHSFDEYPNKKHVMNMIDVIV